MSKNKKKIRGALLEGLAEIVLTLICFGIGALILSLFGVNLDSANIDDDVLVLLGILVIFIILAVVCAIVLCFKKITRNKSE